MRFEAKIQWARFILFLAAVYNVIWGIVVSLVPQLILFDDVSPPFMLIILRCVGMLVGVYGIAYYIASKDPAKYWPLVLVGYIGKILGPIGAFYYVYAGEIKKEFLIVNLYNDFIWLIPFTWIIWQAMKGKLSPPAASAHDPLYSKAMGKSFAALPPALQDFHTPSEGKKFTGTFTVKRGNNFISRLMGDMSRLPAAAEVSAVEIHVVPSAKGETWTRVIGGKKVVSKQWLDGDYIAERIMGMDLWLKAEMIDGSLHINGISATILGMPMPPFLSPVAKGIEKASADGISVNVDFSIKPFGRIINYSGVIRPAASRAQ